MCNLLSRHSHQVTLLALAKLQEDAFLLTDGPHDDAGRHVWREDMLQYPTSKFWDMIMKYEVMILTFVRAHREKNFIVYFEVLDELIHLFFALDHVNYARWTPIHIRDMKSLPQSIRDEFSQRCHWVLPKTNNKFSSIPFDQAHEQENKVVKGAGGAIGLTENPIAFR